MLKLNIIKLWRGGQRPFLLIFTLLLGLSSLLTLWLMLSALTRPVYADTLCVKPGGGDGCHASINAALAFAQENDTIRVAAGVYQENVFISRTVTLQGGWSPDFSIRDINNFSSTINPLDNTQSVVAIQGQFGAPQTVAPTVDGFVISGGRADLNSNHGGGLSIRDSNALIISNTIENNVAFLLGGGVWVQRGAPRIQGNQIRNNLTVGLGQQAYGGGVQLEATQALLSQNIFSRNVVSGTEAYGGGVQISSTGSGQVMLRQNQFISNTALAHPNAAPAELGYGGALALGGGQAQFYNNTMISNTAATAGGGIFIGGSFEDCCNLTGQNNLVQFNTAVQGGGIFVGGDGDDCCQFHDTNTIVQNNSAENGGGLFIDGQHAALEGSLFISNTAVADGGGLFIETGSMISFTNSAAIANLAGQNGGAIYNSGLISVSNTTLSGNRADIMGGGIANFDLINMANTTISDNASPDGAGLLNVDTVNIRNSLIALNDGNNCLGVLTSLGHNLEDGGTCALGQPSDMPNTAPSLDPLGSYGGGTPTHALAADSPAIDAGDNTACPATDQRGGARPVDGDGDGQAVCDIGAYEYGATLPWLYLPLVMRP